MTTPPPWDPPPGDQGPYGQPPSGPPTWDPNAPYAAGPGYPTPAPAPGGTTGGMPGGMPGYPYHVPAYLDPTDPVVPPPGSGFEAWFSRVMSGLRRSWRSLALILGLTQGLPVLVLSIAMLVYFGTATSFFTFDPNEPASSGEWGPILGGFIVFVIVFAVVVSLVQSAGYAAATWAMVREAAGEPAPLGAALRYGLGRMVGVWGWSLLYGLVVGAGLCLCIIPGIYFGVALALFGPVYVFEREAPFGRAWRMFHDNFGAVLGRVLLIAAVSLAVNVIMSVIQNLLSIPFTTAGDPSGAPLPVGVFLAVLGAVALIPPAMVQVVGLITTYAEQRARQAPLSTAQLHAELS